MWKKEQIPWNKGLTKYTDERVKKYADKLLGHPVSDKLRELFIQRTKNKPAWNKGLTKETDERIRNYADKISKTKKGCVPWNLGKPCSFKGKKFSEILGEERAKEVSKIISEGKKGDNNPMKNPKHKQAMINGLLLVSDTEEYKKHCSEAGKKGGAIACLSICKNKPYIWNSVHFMSKAEMNVAKKILKEPIMGTNCHIRINSKVFDFFPQSYDKKYHNCFVEYHPYDFDGKTDEQYYKERKQVIEDSKYKGTKLILIKNKGGIEYGNEKRSA